MAPMLIELMSSWVGYGITATLVGYWAGFRHGRRNVASQVIARVDAALARAHFSAGTRAE